MPDFKIINNSSESRLGKTVPQSSNAVLEENTLRSITARRWPTAVRM